MQPSQRPPLIHGHPPDPSEYFWLNVSLPDGLYALPPDDPTQQSETVSPDEALYLAGVIFAFGLLVALLALALVAF